VEALNVWVVIKLVFPRKMTPGFIGSRCRLTGVLKVFSVQKMTPRCFWKTLTSNGCAQGKRGPELLVEIEPVRR